MIDINNLNVVDVDFPRRYQEKIFDNESKKMNIKVECFTFETLYIPHNNSKKLFVLLSSGGRSVQDTRFDRWSMYGYSDANVLCVEDPMYKLYKRLATGWYFGTKDHSAVHELKQIIDKIMFDKQIDKSDICVVGSSCGGYAALYLTNLIQGCCCIAMNPQFIVSNWGKSSETLEKRIGMSLLNDEDPFARNNISYIKEDTKSKYFIIGNKNVKRDWDNQLNVFLSEVSPTEVEGCSNILSYNNFIFYISGNKYTRPHYNVIDSLGLILINDIIKAPVPNFTAIQTLMNVEEKTWEMADKFVNYEFWNEFLKDIYLGYNLSCPNIIKNKVVINSTANVLSITVTGKLKFKALEFVVSFKNQQIASKFMKIFDDENLEDLQISQKQTGDNILKITVSDDLKSKFIRIISIVDKFFVLERNFISENS